jgi:drug/metabolite transporter (DMT)-like permease
MLFENIFKRQRNRNFTVYGALLLVQLILSGWNVLASLIINNEVNPLVFTCYRELIALFILYGTAILLDGGFQTPACEHLGHLALLGLLNYINILGYTLGLTYTSPETVAVYQGSIPLLTAFLGILAKQEKFDKLKLSGISVAVMGALVAAAYAKTEIGRGSEAVLGNVLLIAESISISSFLVFQRPLLHYYSHTWVVAWGYTGAVVLCILSSLYFVEHPSNWSIKGVEREIALVYSAVVASGLVQNLMAWGNMITRSTIVATFTTMQPMFNAVIYYGPGHKSYKLTLPVIIGGIVAFLGIVITCWRDHILYSPNNESDDPIFNYNYKTSSNEPRSSESRVSQSTRTIQSVHYHTPADRIGFVGTGYTPIISDGQERLRAPTDTLRHSRVISNESPTMHGFRKAIRYSMSTSNNANQYIAL